MVYEVSDNDEELKDVFDRTRKAKNYLKLSIQSHSLLNLRWNNDRKEIDDSRKVT